MPPKGKPPEPPRRAPEGWYRASNTVDVTVRRLDAVGPVVDAAVSAGANQVWGIHFALEAREQAESELRGRAVADARARAEQLARLHGRRLGDVLSISELVGRGGRPDFAMAAVAEAQRGTPVAPGELVLSGQLEVRYALGARTERP